MFNFLNDAFNYKFNSRFQSINVNELKQIICESADSELRPMNITEFNPVINTIIAHNAEHLHVL